MNNTIVLSIGGVIIAVGLLLLLIGMRKGLLTKRNYDLEKEVTNLMYEQHKVLFLLSGKLFEQQKIEESYFFEKRKFLLGTIDKDYLLAFLNKGKEDISFVQGLKTST